MPSTRRCPRGKFYRKQYTRRGRRGSRHGRRIAGKCIRRQTRSKISSRNYQRIARGRMTRRMRGVRMTRRGIKSCPRSYIMRNAYMRYTKRGKHILVPAACIKDVGRRGKGLASGRPGIGILKQGNLTRYGYSKVATMAVSARRNALKKAVDAYGALTTWRKLNALAIYTRRSSPKTSHVVSADMNWIRSTWGLKAF